MERVLVAMSGGVDSSVAAKMLQERGYECVGCTMRLYDNEDLGVLESHTCCSIDDVEDARSVAHKLHMPYYVFNFSEAFKQEVIERFVRGYESGVTPNPCIDCNRYIKFDKLLKRASIMSCGYIATGHYARIEKNNGKYVLKKALDESKDQSYVLYSMTQEQLAHTLFPLGDLYKKEARELAEKWGFLNARKPDSQDLCFVPSGNYAEAVERYSGRKAEVGYFRDRSGNILGEHRGITHYTIGQHKGLGLSLSVPQYVYGIYPETNTVVLSSEEELYKDTLIAENFNWISGDTPQGAVRCKAKIRYRQPEQSVTATILPSGAVGICFDEPQRAISPGQAVVLYDGDTVLGGGTIEKRTERFILK